VGTLPNYDNNSLLCISVRPHLIGFYTTITMTFILYLDFLESLF